ncbi:FAD-binding oxidoreductase [Candidiatus Paracoxiella cheracis]|uniref:FAD-binding oxidoreductase n=1 Tax=Candidiatus Paracoxiella cheracis TaxID=3405120 RepID=UPI003BF47AB0
MSTNAGGIKVIRYGATRDWVAGLKVVTGKGDLLDCNKGLIKNATGYDLRQLFIGAEGTLGFVVEATMRLTTKPQDLNVIVLGLVELDAIMEVLHAFRQKIELTAFEFFSDKALEFVIKYKKLPPPFETRAKYYALIEYERNHEGIDDHVLRLFEYCMERGWVIDGAMSQNGQQFNNLWHLREYISETIIQFTPCKFDLSVKVSKMPEFLHAVDAYLQKNFQEFISIWFGHIGDGNLHLNILKPADEKPETFFKTCEKLNVDIFKLIKDYEGAISAEHGIGLLRKHYLTDTRSAEEIKYMRAIQQVFDPNGIMNPGKIFD